MRVSGACELSRVSCLHSLLDFVPLDVVVQRRRAQLVLDVIHPHLPYLGVPRPRGHHALVLLQGLVGDIYMRQGLDEWFSALGRRRWGSPGCRMLRSRPGQIQVIATSCEAPQPLHGGAPNLGEARLPIGGDVFSLVSEQELVRGCDLSRYCIVPRLHLLESLQRGHKSAVEPVVFDLVVKILLLIAASDLGDIPHAQGHGNRLGGHG
mmetsp:Transcript_29962/g.59519  ORF Transcript_29962/g.59519 Transcript_29962/m.59519 type:complete len:208 (+) Transcript_29962:350-973(+)